MSNFGPKYAKMIQTCRVLWWFHAGGKPSPPPLRFLRSAERRAQRMRGTRLRLPLASCHLWLVKQSREHTVAEFIGWLLVTVH